MAYKNNRKRPNIDLAAKKAEYTRLLAFFEEQCENGNSIYHDKHMNRNVNFEKFENHNIAKIKNPKFIKMSRKVETEDGVVDLFEFSFKDKGQVVHVKKTFDKKFALEVYMLRRLQTACDMGKVGQQVVRLLEPLMKG